MEKHTTYNLTKYTAGISAITWPITLLGTLDVTVSILRTCIQIIDPEYGYVRQPMARPLDIEPRSSPTQEKQKQQRGEF